VLHEFSSIPGVREDVTDIILNIKLIALRLNGEGPRRMVLKAEGPCEVDRRHDRVGHDIELMNPGLVLCTLAEGAKLAMELRSQRQGLRSGRPEPSEDPPIGLIPVVRCSRRSAR
jgi:DNA-directed RNA polymerase subunit alpha